MNNETKKAIEDIKQALTRNSEYEEVSNMVNAAYDIGKMAGRIEILEETTQKHEN